MLKYWTYGLRKFLIALEFKIAVVYRAESSSIFPFIFTKN